MSVIICIVLMIFILLGASSSIAAMIAIKKVEQIMEVLRKEGKM